MQCQLQACASRSSRWGRRPNSSIMMIILGVVSGMAMELPAGCHCVQKPAIDRQVGSQQELPHQVSQTLQHEDACGCQRGAVAVLESCCFRMQCLGMQASSQLHNVCQHNVCQVHHVKQARTRSVRPSSMKTHVAAREVPFLSQNPAASGCSLLVRLSATSTAASRAPNAAGQAKAWSMKW